MANRFFDREQRYGSGYDEEERYGRGSENWRYGQGNYGSDPYYRGYGSSYPGYGSSSYEPYRGYGSYDYGRYETGSRYGEPSWRGQEDRYSDPYYRNRVYRGFNRGWEDRGENERGFLERAGDEVRSWFGDEEATRRRREDEMRSQHAGRGPKGYRRSDERIREDVNERLTGDYYLDAHDIEVSVSEGVVTLTGRVDNRRDKRRAEDLAEMVSGVTDVNNQLSVSPSTTATPTGTELTGTRSRTART